MNKKFGRPGLLRKDNATCDADRVIYHVLSYLFVFSFDQRSIVVIR